MHLPEVENAGVDVSLRELSAVRAGVWVDISIEMRSCLLLRLILAIGVLSRHLYFVLRLLSLWHFGWALSRLLSPPKHIARRETKGADVPINEFPAARIGRYTQLDVREYAGDTYGSSFYAHV